MKKGRKPLSNQTKKVVEKPPESSSSSESDGDDRGNIRFDKNKKPIDEESDEEIFNLQGGSESDDSDQVCVCS